MDFIIPECLNITIRKCSVVKYKGRQTCYYELAVINPLNAELIPICYLLALLEITILSTLAG